MTTTDTISEAVETGMDGIFKAVADGYGLKYGDVAPEQAAQLEDIKQQLADLLGDYVHQNVEV